jgi:hypothetical protein
MREGRFCATLFEATRNSLILKRRDVRVVEGARLESVCRGNSTVGSNPTLSDSLTSFGLRLEWSSRLQRRASHAVSGTESHSLRQLP